MFYNFFIPGGIGGDAYKVYLLHKRFGWKLKTVTQNVFVDRLVGLVAIVCIAFLISSFLFFDIIWTVILALTSAVAVFVIAKFLLKQIFPSVTVIYTKSFVYSLGIQLLQIGSVYCILLSIGIDASPFEYFLVFLISSVVSVVSFSGFGAREFVFLQATVYLATDAATATSIGLTFNLITATVSLLGALFLLKKVALKLIST